jgi:hypothetical protein
MGCTPEGLLVCRSWSCSGAFRSGRAGLVPNDIRQGGESGSIQIGSQEKKKMMEEREGATRLGT